MLASLLLVALPPPVAPPAELPDRDRVLQAIEDGTPRVLAPDGTALPHLRVEHRVADGAVRARLVNDGEEPAAVGEVRLWSWEHHLPGTTGLYGEGLQMLSQTGGTLDAPEDLGYLTDRGHYRLVPAEGVKAAVYGLLMLRDDDRRRLLLGFTSCRRFVGRFDVREGRIDVVLEGEGCVLGPGASWELEELAVFAGDHRDDLLAALGARIARAHPPRFRAAPPRGWCSWYCFGPRVTTEDVRRNLAWIAQSGMNLPYVQIDDGYQAAMGDWLVTGDAFGGGVEKVLGEIRDARFEPAIWVAPFIAEEGSQLFREHPDWFVRGPDGEPLRSDAVSFGGWRRGPWYCLDGTHPAARAHLTALFRTMREEWGCSYFKLDAIFWGMMHGGTFHDPEATRVEAYRRGMAAVLAGAGDAFVLGCNHPIWPSFGLIDGSRSSMDVNRQWETMRRTGRENLHRNWQNGVLWWNDPDCLLVQAELPENELRFHASLVHATGGMVLLGDDLPRVDPAGVARLRRVAAPTGVPARFADETLDVGVMELEGERRVFLFNETDQAYPRRFTLPTQHRVVDFWTDEGLGEYAGVMTLTLAPRSARVLRCFPLE